MRPYIICHMSATLDGRIDCDMLEAADPTDNYYVALEKLACDATLEGRVTLEKHYAEKGHFWSSRSYAEAGQQVYIAPEAQACIDAGEPKFAIGVDTTGKLLWGNDTQEKFGRPLVMILSEYTDLQYLADLQSKGISYITIGTEEERQMPGMPKGFTSMQGPAIDLKGAMEILVEQFGIKRLAVVGGGHINGSFLRAGLLDEVSMLYCPAIDGRAGLAAAFDGIPEQDRPATPLQLASVEQLGESVWMRYRVK